MNDEIALAAGYVRIHFGIGRANAIYLAAAAVDIRILDEVAADL